MHKDEHPQMAQMNADSMMTWGIVWEEGERVFDRIYRIDRMGCLALRIVRLIPPKAGCQASRLPDVWIKAGRYTRKRHVAAGSCPGPPRGPAWYSLLLRAFVV